MARTMALITHTIREVGNDQRILIYKNENDVDDEHYIVLTKWAQENLKRIEKRINQVLKSNNKIPFNAVLETSFNMECDCCDGTFVSMTTDHHAKTVNLTRTWLNLHCGEPVRSTVKLNVVEFGVLMAHHRCIAKKVILIVIIDSMWWLWRFSVHHSPMFSNSLPPQ